MEVLVIEDAKEVEASIAVEDDGTATFLKEKKRRRVSFAHTDTVHVIPRNDDIETPPLLLSADPLSIKQNTPLPSELAIAGVPASEPAILRSSTADRDLLSASHLHENSADFSQFTCDMDTGHGSWADEDFTNHKDSFDGFEDDSGCFVHIGHISRLEDDDSIVNDVMNDDMTMDATTFSRNLSHYLKSGTNFDLQGTGLLGQVVSHKNANDSDSRSEDDTMALTKPGAPHWALVNPQDVSMHADDDQSDMSLATGLMGQEVASQKNVNQMGQEVDSQSEDDRMDFPKPGPPNWALVSPQDVSMHTDDDQSDMSLATGTVIFNTTVPICNLKDLLLDHTDYTITRKLPRGVDMSTSKIFASPSSNKGVIVEIAQKASSESADQSFFIRDAMKSSGIKEHAVKVSRHSNISASIVVVEQHSSQLKGVNENVLEKKPVLMEVKKQNKGQQLLESSLQRVVVEPRSLSKGGQQARPVLADSTNLPKVQPKDNLQESKKFYKTSSQEIRMAMSSKVSAGVGILGGIGKDPRTKGLRCLEDILQCLEGKTHNEEDQGREEDMVPLLPTKLQTLDDYLQFSCSVQPQMDWLSEHVQELEAKLQAAKKRNAEIKSSNIFVQNIPEESTLIFKTKFASKHSLAKKEWLLWKMKPEKQILASLQENKENLIKEVEAVHGKGQQVLHLKDQVLHLKESYEERKGMLEKYHHHYQDSRDRLRVSKDKWNKIQTKIQSIASVYVHKVQFAADSSEVSFEKNLEALIRRLFFTNSLLQQQQVMRSTLKSNGGKSLIDFSLEGMCSQSFQFEGDGPSAQVKLFRTLHPEAIEMAFPCMDASLFFQYINSDLHNIASVKMQQVHRIIQRTNCLFGCLMDVLKEIRYCRRNFGISCKFQMQKDKLLLCVTFLRCTSGLKVTLTFDMVCVKEGMYPSDLKPADIRIETYGHPLNGSITRREMLARIAKIQPGFARIHRICSCVEELMRNVKENA